jgi:hypothetical protein
MKKRVSIVKYDLKGLPVVKKTLIHRALYGYIDHSNKGTYTYNRKGALAGIEYTKIGNATILLETKFIDQLIPLFKRYKIKIKIMDMVMA